MKHAALLIFIFAFALSGCSVPSPRFLGSESSVAEYDGMSFRVYQRGDEVEVLRVGGGVPRKSRVFLGAIQAIEAATLCPVRPRSMKGDQSVVVAKIDCD